MAIATSAMAVGRAAPWARAGVGAVLTQAQTNRMYGPRGLDLLAGGSGAKDALDLLAASDHGRETRQVAIADASGGVAVWTGRGCLSACGHVTGDGFSAQGNTLSSRSVIPSMAEAFLAAEGWLAERLVRALQGAEEAGGDLRGRQSAAILVVSGQRTDAPWEEVLVDLRVDDNPDPVAELARLVKLQRAYESGDLAMLRDRGPGGVPELYAALDAARHGDREKAREALAALRQRPGWEGVLRRMHTRLATRQSSPPDESP